jgi:CHAT domain-containing protein/tetratricopeptide (TPR) repeat protein
MIKVQASIIAVAYSWLLPIVTPASSNSVADPYGLGWGQPQALGTVLQEKFIPDPNERDPQGLEYGKAVERVLARADLHTYKVSLSSGQYLRIVVEQRGAMTGVRILFPNAAGGPEMAASFGNRGPESISVIAEASGDYTVEVRSLESHAKGGLYEIRIEELRNATDLDRHRVEAENAFAEAQKLRQERTFGWEWESILRYRDALSGWSQAGDRFEQARTLYCIGEAYLDLSRRESAIASYGLALDVQRAIGDTRGEGYSLSRIGLCNHLLGNMQFALYYYKEALRVREFEQDLANVCESLSSICGVYVALGDLQKALDSAYRVLDLRVSMGDGTGTAQAYTVIGNILQSLGESQKALAHYERALDVFRGSDRKQEEATLIAMGRAYASLSDFGRAVDCYAAVLDTMRKSRDIVGRMRCANVLGLMGHALALSGNRRDAMERYKEALSIFRVLRVSSGEADTYKDMAILERDQGALSEARALIGLALEAVESSPQDLSSQYRRAHFLASVRDIYDVAVDVQMQLQQHEPSARHDALALHLSEQARAQTLIGILRQANAGTTNGAEGDILARERVLEREIDTNTQRWIQSLTGDKTRGQSALIEKDIESLISRNYETQDKMKFLGAHYAGLMHPQIVPLDQIQKQLLDHDTVLLEYFLGDERSYLWVVTQADMKAYPLPGRKELESAARAVYRLLTTKNSTGRGTSYPLLTKYLPAAARLSQVLLGPVTSQLGNKGLLIVADGVLQYIPFPALPIPKHLDKSPRRKGPVPVPIIAEHEVIYLPSAAALAALRIEIGQRKAAEKAIAVLANPVFDRDDPRVKSAKGPTSATESQVPTAASAQVNSSTRIPVFRGAHTGLARGADESRLPPLPSSKDEAEAISKLVPDQQALIATDFKANRATATGSELSQYRIIHFATHALLNTEHPGMSGIVLSMVDEKGEPQNGFLRLGDIYNLKLPAELVVLSACDTALGKDIKGEGLIGLTRGFMYAGAARVISSLWKVDDEASAELMRRFYQKMLKEGERPAAALRSAQVEMLNTRRWSSPRHWAGFILQGEWR